MLTALLLVTAVTSGWGQITSAQSGLWSSTSTWVGGIVPTTTDNVIIADGHTVTIDATPITVANLTVGQGTSGILMFDGTTVKSMTVTGDITIATGGTFKSQKDFYATGNVTSGSAVIANVSSTSGIAVGMVITGAGIPASTTITAFDATTITLSKNATATGTDVSLSIFTSNTATANTLAIGGNLTNNGTFDMALGLSTYVCNVSFTKTGDQTISGNGTTKFRGITLSKSSVNNKVICSSDVTMNGSALFVFTAGTWEQTSGILTIAGGNQAIGASGALTFTGSGGLSQTGSSLDVTGILTVNTTGTVTVGSGNNRLATLNATAILNFLAGTINVNGRLTLNNGTTTIAGANIAIDPQVNTTYLGATSHAFELSGSANLTFTSGSVTIIDPLNATGTGKAIFISSTGTINLVGSIFNLGNGISTTTGADGFDISSTIPFENITIQAGDIALRNVNATALTINGKLTIKSGTAAITTLTYGPNATLEYAGTAVQTTGSEFLATVPNLTINNANGIALPASKTVTNTLTFTSGKLDIGAYDLTIGSASGYDATKYVVISGIGKLNMNTLGTKVAYPIGTLTSYTPYILENSTSNDILGINVKSTITNAPLDKTKCIQLEWQASEGTPGGNDGTITFQWNASDQGASYNPALPVYFGAWNGTKYDVTQVTVNGSNPYTVTMNAPATYPTSPVIFGNIGAFKSQDATLSNLTFNGTQVSSFTSTTFNYAVALPVGTTTVPTVVATTNNAAANAVITNAANLTGNQVERTTSILVTAEDGSTQTYTIEFSVLVPGEDATLSELQVNGVPLAEFVATTTTYTVALDATTVVPTVTATTTDQFATKIITPATSLTGTLDERTTTIVVTAQNTSTVITYKVIFYIKSNDASLSDLTYNSTQVPSFLSTTLNYNVELPYGTTAIPVIVATKSNEKATVNITPATNLAGDLAARTATILVTAEDGIGSNSYTIVFTVAPAPAPLFTATYPKSANIGSDKFDVIVNANAVGKAYFLKAASGATAPTSAEVKSTGAAINLVAANTDYSSSITGLTKSTTYDVYFITENEAGTVQMATPVKLSVTTLAGATTIHDIQYTTDASGDSPLATQIVTTSGIVTAVKLKSGVQDGFYLQDGVGEWNGIYVYAPAATNTIVAEGNKVTVNGKVEERYKVTQISSVVSITIDSPSNTLPLPVELTTQAANNESYEAVLVKVKNATCASGATGTFVLNDGSADLTAYKGIYAELSLTVGTKYDVTGVLTDYSPASGTRIYELLPRYASDVVIATGISDDDAVSTKAYPNPFSTDFKINAGKVVRNVTVSNMLGQKVMERAYNEIEIDVPASDLRTGVYFVTVKFEDGTSSTLRMVKK